jgi:hypothetical protein
MFREFIHGRVRQIDYCSDVHILSVQFYCGVYIWGSKIHISSSPFAFVVLNVIALFLM